MCSVFRAGGSSKPKIRVVDTETIELNGIEVDVIDFSSDLLPSGDPFGHYDQNEQMLVQSLWHDLSGTNSSLGPIKYINGEDSVTAFSQTLAAGCCYFAERRNGYSSDRVEKYHSERKEVWTGAGSAYLAKLFSKKPSDTSLLDDSSSWVDNTNSIASGRRVMRTRKGYFVLGPPCAMVGDTVCVLFGGKTPYCLRRVENCYRLVGECYVY